MAHLVKIRPYAQADRLVVRDLFVRVNRLLATPALAEAFEDYIKSSLSEEIDRIPEYYRERQGSFWVAMANAAVVGMFGLERAAEGQFELRRMYVDPSARRLGIGRQMLDFAEHEARTRGAREMVLSTSEIQKEALALYRHAGYRETREEIAESRSNKTIGGGIRRHHFSKAL